MTITDQDWGNDRDGTFVKCGLSTGGSDYRIPSNLIPAQHLVHIIEGAMTICFWVQMVNDGTDSPDEGRVFSKSSGTSGNNGFEIFSNGGGASWGTRTFGIAIDGAKMGFLGTPHYEDNVWVHIAMSFSNVQNVTVDSIITINGQTSYTYDTVNSESMVDKTFTAGTAAFLLGGEGTLGISIATPSNCFLKHIRIYNRLLAIHEIRKLHDLRI